MDPDCPFLIPALTRWTKYFACFRGCGQPEFFPDISFLHNILNKPTVVNIKQVLANCYLLTANCYLKCIAASVSFSLAGSRTAILGCPYLGLMVWQPSSQYTPSAAICGSGMGEFTATSRSASSSLSTSAIRFLFCSGVSHFFPSRNFSNRSNGSRLRQKASISLGT